MVLNIYINLCFKNKMLFNLHDLNHDEKFALLYGIMLGDGCLSLVKSKTKCVVITCNLDDLPFFNKVVSFLLREFRKKETKIKFRKDCNAIEFNFVDPPLFDTLHSFGLPIGKKGPNLIIPEFFYKNNLLRHIIQGFFATDGSLVLTKNPNKFYPRIEGNGISKDLIFQVSNYLNKVGMKGSFYDSKRKKFYFKREFCQKQYRFQFNGKKNLLLFNEKIGFVNPKHQLKFDRYLEYDSKYIPLSGDNASKDFFNEVAVPRIELGTSSL